MLRFTPLIAFAVLLAVSVPGRVAIALTSQNVPAADLPSVPATPGINPPTSMPSPALVPPSPEEVSPSGSQDESVSEKSSPAPQSSPLTAASPGPEENTDTDGAEENTDTEGKEGSLGTEAGSDEGAGDNQSGGETAEPTATATEPPPALDTSALTPGPDLGNASLEPEIQKAVAPGLAASLRLTEDARKQLSEGETGDAMRGLARAVSIDPSDAFAYYYLGRGYLQKKNYAQALTFFRRAELGFSGRSDWSAEVLSYEGTCDEELGKTSDAVQAYQRALAASPNNLRARVGYGRLAAVAGPVGNLNAPPPAEDDLFSPPTSTSPESAPSQQAPPPPPEDQPD